MGPDDDILRALHDRRAEIRREQRSPNGKEPPVCSDDILREMAVRLPNRREDLLALTGVGPRFVEVYGDSFLEVTGRFCKTAAKGESLDEDVARILRDLQRKLVDVSKGNRLLFQPRLFKKAAFDLMSIPDTDCLGLLFGGVRSIRLCDTSKGGDDVKRYRDLNEVIREVNRDLRDKGQYDLYIAYPFVEGRLPGEDFDIRCPLALFPVILEKDQRSVTLSRDDTRDPVYNNSLITAFMKFNGRSTSLPHNVIEDPRAESFLPDLVRFYEEQGLRINRSVGHPVPFVDYRAGGFPRYNPGEMHMVHNIVVGKYPTYSNGIQRDFDELIAKGEINGILADLVADLNLCDFLSELPHPLSAEDIRDRGMEAREVDLTYINSLNSAQENIITSMRRGDRLVVQGPPGTGKSQVITGLITSAAAEGRTVLMVSEKKTALDVVYSRLGNLSRYCMMIDDAADKEGFYLQLREMLDAEQPLTRPDLSGLSEAVDDGIRRLTAIADSLYAPGEFGVEPYRLYTMDRWLDLSDRRQLEEYRGIKAHVPSELMALGYDRVEALHRRYNDPALARNLKEYSDCVQKTPWLGRMRPDLTEYDIGEMRAGLMDLEEQILDLNRKSLLSRMFSKGKVNREATALLSRYMEDYNEHVVRYAMEDPSGMLEGLDDYDLYSSRVTVYNRLARDERLYGRGLLSLSEDMGLTAAEGNERIRRFIMNTHLQEFDAANKDVLQEIRDFDSIIDDIDRSIGLKMELSRAKVEETLRSNLDHITGSKRRGDILRIAESRRKWSLRKFIDRYGYELFKGIRVWLMTPESVSEILPLEMGVFDLVIFDEASQMYVEKGIPSIYRAKKVVVAGDHKQLRPSNLGSGRIEYVSEEDGEDDEVSAALEEESLLDLARTRYDNILLNFHYRSQYEELIAFSNHAFYGGRLYVSPNVKAPDRPPIEVHRVDGRWENRSNRAEAARIVELLKDFFRERRGSETIGIITFNVSQRDLINDLIDEEAGRDHLFGRAVGEEMQRFDKGEDVGLFIKNIESVQGDERDVIMFSMGYAKNAEGKLMQRFGWLNNRGGENRLNVAISRARRKIHIVTSFDPDELHVEDAKNEGPRILKKYLQYAWAVNDGEREHAAAILGSFRGVRRPPEQSPIGDAAVADRVHRILVRKGYTVERDVGIGGYTMDLAVKQDDAYILGIECDSRIYGMSTTTRERDYHRQKYLESRGWRIHRVWTPWMWKDPEDEIARLVKAIEHSD